MMERYSLYTPEFTQTGETTPSGAAIYSVAMRERALVSLTSEDAMSEAKALGIRHPIVGLAGTRYGGTK